MKPEEQLYKALFLGQCLVQVLDDIENLPPKFNKIKNASKNFNATLTKEFLKQLDAITNVDIELTNNVMNTIERRSDIMVKKSLSDFIK